MHVAKKNILAHDGWISFPDNIPSFAFVPRKLQRVPGQQVGILKIYEDGFAVPIQPEFLMVSLASLEVIAIFMVVSFP